MNDDEVKITEDTTSDVKIFVCHTPGRESVLPENPMYVHILGGAALAKENPQNLMGDNSGDNISMKNKSYCELTVQYWAWKNTDADYYGFCHYRRYFSFNSPEEEQIPNMYANVPFEYFNDKIMSQIDVDIDFIIKKMKKNPIALTTLFDVKNVKAFSIYNHYKITPSLHNEDLDILLEVIHEICPEYDKAAKEHLKSHLLYPCNMFIMKRPLFFRYCEWLFPIMEECERRIDASNYTEEEFRGIGHLAERCLGIFYTYINRNENVEAVFFQRLLIENPSVGIKPRPRSKNPVTVVTAASGFYVPYLAVMIQSLAEHTSSNRNYEICVLHTDISDENKKKMWNMVKIYPNIHLIFYNIAMDISDFSFRCSEWGEHISNETFYRTLLHKIFTNYKKVIYFDSDMIIKADVAELFDTDIGDNLIGACLDPDFIGMYCSNFDSKFYTETVLKIKHPFEYFQGGVLLVNIEQFKGGFSDTELAEEAAVSNYRWVDQDLFNVACHGKVAFIDMSWNVMVQHKWDRLKVIKQCPFEISKQYFDARENPKIIHYAGGQKPWIEPWIDFGSDFWSVAYRNVYFGELLWRMSHDIVAYVLNETANKRISAPPPPPLPEKSSLLKKLAVGIASPFFPEGTKRREKLRRLYNKVRGKG
ncbi:MAG: DUF4422 domain-containing protein [Treponema sp.]|jgi:lipopolysaccharide biosynthesis glycosyltransferase|nr:DUF4422 domain-containing protein [Treponema sp.]